MTTVYFRVLENGAIEAVADGEIDETTNSIEVVDPPQGLKMTLIGEGDLKLHYHMLGGLPAITKRGLTAYLFPGSQTDALDGAPYVSSEGGGLELTPEHWVWLMSFGVEKILKAAQDAEKRIVIAEKHGIRHCNWFDKFPEE